MAIQVVYDDKGAENSIKLIDDTNNQYFSIPIDSVSDVLNRIHKTHYNETLGRMTDEDRKALDAELHEFNKKIKPSFFR